MRDALKMLWNEPRVENPPPPRRRDWILTALLVVGAFTESLLRDTPWEAAELIVIVAVALTLPWRRLYPFALSAFAFGSMLIVQLGIALTGAEGDGIYTGAFFLVFPYVLLRWGSGRDALLALPVLLALPWIEVVTGTIVLSESIGGTIFLLFPAAIGASIRYRASSREQAMERVRLNEREQIARELHDTVAHHVSAIAIQAQAGRTVASTDPAAAMRTLDVIEEAASRTLEEMRAMVGVLRTGNEEIELAPQPTMSDIDRLVEQIGPGPQVEQHLTGDFDELRPAVSTALYRLAQESITNARRHAAHATSIDVHIAANDETVRLTVIDDGPKVASADRPSGFGLAGMAERAKALGGTFAAGPHPQRGWVVQAVLPRNGDGS